MSSPSRGTQGSKAPSALNTHSPTPAGNGDEKPRLTREEKKQNHIASEHKRRQAIREGFDRLTELVPGLEGQGRSEGLVLKRTAEFIREQMAKRDDLVRRIEEAGGEVDPRFKIPWDEIKKAGDMKVDPFAATASNHDMPSGNGSSRAPKRPS